MIADVSVATGISPRELLALDASMFDEVLQAVERRWSPELELSASLLEVVHAHFLNFVRVHSKKGATIPKPLQVTRPWMRDVEEEDAREDAPVVSLSDVAKLGGAGVALKGVQR